MLWLRYPTYVSCRGLTFSSEMPSIHHCLEQDTGLDNFKLTQSGDPSVIAKDLGVYLIY